MLCEMCLICFMYINPERLIAMACCHLRKFTCIEQVSVITDFIK